MEFIDLIETRVKQRLFFALWPDDEIRAQLASVVSAMPHRLGKPVANRNLHITLVFLGLVDADMTACFHNQALNIIGKPFRITLSELGYFRRSRVLWLGSEQCPEPLLALVQILNGKLKSCGFRPETRPFSPHITLFRKAHPLRGGLSDIKIEWQVDSFYLVESQTRPEGAQYHLVQEYPLNET